MASYPTLTFPDELPYAVRAELEQLISLLQGYLSVEHEPDGTHGAITADSVTVSGDITASGTITAGGLDAQHVSNLVGSDKDVDDVVIERAVLNGNTSGSVEVGTVLDLGQWKIQAHANTAGATTPTTFEFYNTLHSGRVLRFLPSSTTALTIRPGIQTGSLSTFAITLGASNARFTKLYASDVDSPIAHLTGTVTASQITADQNNYNPANLATATHLRVSSDAARSITGIAAQSDGRLLWLSNGGGFDITLVNNSASSTAGNRFVCANATDVVVRANNGNVLLRYDADVSGGFWFVLGA